MQPGFLNNAVSLWPWLTVEDVAALPVIFRVSMAKTFAAEQLVYKNAEKGLNQTAHAQLVCWSARRHPYSHLEVSKWLQDKTFENAPAYLQPQGYSTILLKAKLLSFYTHPFSIMFRKDFVELYCIKYYKYPLNRFPGPWSLLNAERRSPRATPLAVTVDNTFFM
jgi:hypothetical protein